jgi:hypothetical protein
MSSLLSDWCLEEITTMGNLGNIFAQPPRSISALFANVIRDLSERYEDSQQTSIVLNSTCPTSELPEPPKILLLRRVTTGSPEDDQALNTGVNTVTPIFHRTKLLMKTSRYSPARYMSPPRYVSPPRYMSPPRYVSSMFKRTLPQSPNPNHMLLL